MNQSEEPIRREIIIDGNKFDNLEQFYDEIDKLLTKNLTWKTGHNLNAFNDLLSGGFGVHEYGEPLLLKWINYKKSKSDFGYDATVLYFKDMLKTCHPSNIENVKEYLKDAESHIGGTLIDFIVETILDPNSAHDCKLETID